MNIATGIQIVWITPGDIAVAVLLGALLVLVSVGLGWWARGWAADSEADASLDLRGVTDAIR